MMVHVHNTAAWHIEQDDEWVKMKETLFLMLQ